MARIKLNAKQRLEAVRARDKEEFRVPRDSDPKPTVNKIGEIKRYNLVDSGLMSNFARLTPKQKSIATVFLNKGFKVTGGWSLYLNREIKELVELTQNKTIYVITQTGHAITVKKNWKPKVSDFNK